MPDFNSINFNAPSITNQTVSQGKTNKEEETSEKPVQNEVKSENPQVNEKDVFSFMANGAVISRVNVKLSPAALVARYNTPEQIKNIEAMMTNMDAKVDDEGMNMLDNEFADIPEYQDMSVANKRALALAYLVNKSEGFNNAIGQMFDGVAESVVDGLAGY